MGWSVTVAFPSHIHLLFLLIIACLLGAINAGGISLFFLFSLIDASQSIIFQPCHLFVCFVCFVALRPKSTAMVMAGRSVHLTTLFLGQA